MSVDLAVIADPAAELAYRAELAREHYRGGWSEGWSEGFVTAIKAYKSAQHGLYRDAQLEPERYRVCCRECRRTGHRDGCERCEDRDRETYSRPHPDDFQGRTDGRAG